MKSLAGSLVCTCRLTLAFIAGKCNNYKISSVLVHIIPARQTNIYVQMRRHCPKIHTTHFLLSDSGKNTVNSEIFVRTLFSRMRSFVKKKPLQNGKITLSFIDIGKSCMSIEFFTSLICLLMIFAKIKFSGKFPNLQYYSTYYWNVTPVFVH